MEPMRQPAVDADRGGVDSAAAPPRARVRSNRVLWLWIGLLVVLWLVAMFFRWEIRARWWAYRLAAAPASPEAAYYEGCLASVGDRSLGALRGLLRHPSADVRRRAAAILHWCRTEGSRTVLLEAMRDPDGEVRETAALGLAFHHDAAALPELLRMVRSGEGDVALAAAVALERIGGPAATEALLEVLRGDAPPLLRAQAIDSLGLLGAKQAVPLLIDCLRDERTPATRPAADRRALQAIRAAGLDFSRLGIDPSKIDTGRPETIAELAARALHRITGESFGFTTTQPADRKEAIIRLYRQWWQAHASS